jgi:methionine biosynthesis protein MetW
LHSLESLTWLSGKAGFGSEFTPATSSLRNHWFDAPNIHLCTVNDFEALCKLKNINILERTVVDHTHSKSTLPMRLFPNLFGVIGIYRLCRNSV